MKNKKKAIDILWIIRKMNELLPIFFFVFLIFGFEEPLMATVTILSALIHEVGHISYLLFAKRLPLNIRGVLSGFRIRANNKLTYDQTMLTYLFGPLFNLLVFVVTALLSLIFGKLFALISIINLATALSNLLPIEGYDGYGILYTLIQKREMENIWLRPLYRLSSALIFLFCIFSLYLIDRQGGGYWIFAIFFISMLKCIKADLGE